MRFHMLAVLGFALSIPVAAAAQEHKCEGGAVMPAPEHTCACCARDGHSDHTAIAAPAYDVQHEGLVAGVIYSVMHHPGMDVQLTLGVGEKSFEVLVAPSDWLDSKHAVFRPGERVEIVGARTDRGSGETIVAREIHTADQTIVVRDSQGRPLWN